MRLAPWSELLRFLAMIVIAGVAVNVASDYLGEQFPGVSAIVVWVGAGGVALVVVSMLTWSALAWMTGGRYAVEALILDAEGRLLLYHHPHHKCMLPPGGRVRRMEFPDTALQLRLQERLELGPQQYAFDARFHHGLEVSSGNLGVIQRAAAPFLVQRELQGQRRWVRFHYDMIYVLRLLDETVDFGRSRYAPVHFVDEDALEEMVAQRGTFPDVLDAYRRVLAVLESSAA